MTPTISTATHINKSRHTNRKKSGKHLRNTVKRINDTIYQVKSITKDETYRIVKTPQGWVCSCPDYTYRGVKCKHMYAVEYRLNGRKTSEVKDITYIYNRP